jgi:hypothetical protein
MGYFHFKRKNMPTKTMYILHPGADIMIPIDIEKKSKHKQLQKAVGGYIELVSIKKSAVHNSGKMYVNEEGLLRNLQYNTLASIIAGMNIVGTVVIDWRKSK